MDSRADRATSKLPRNCACHRLRKTAPVARPARRKGDRAGRSPGSRVTAPFRLPRPGATAPAQWHFGRELAADSCGGSSGFGGRLADRKQSFRPVAVLWVIFARQTVTDAI